MTKSAANRPRAAAPPRLETGKFRCPSAETGAPALRQRAKPGQCAKRNGGDLSKRTAGQNNDYGGCQCDSCAGTVGRKDAGHTPNSLGDNRNGNKLQAM